MDHKEFFEIHGNRAVCVGLLFRLPFTIEDLYQAIKRRLIAELVAEDSDVRWPYRKRRLIDTTDTGAR
jgi:hypothetical protein